MFALVVFTDRVLYICDIKDIQVFKQKCPAIKYFDNKKYSGRILALHENPVLLGLIQANIMGTLQSVHFDTFNYTGEKIGCVDLIENCKKHVESIKMYLETNILPSTTSSGDYHFPGEDFLANSPKLFGKLPLFSEIEIEMGSTSHLSSSETNSDTFKPDDEMLKNPNVMDINDNISTVPPKADDVSHTTPNDKVLQIDTKSDKKPKIVNIEIIPAMRSTRCSNLNMTYDSQPTVENGPLRNEMSNEVEVRAEPPLEQSTLNSCISLENLNPSHFVPGVTNLSDYAITPNASFAPPVCSSTIINSSVSMNSDETETELRTDTTDTNTLEDVPSAACSSDTSTSCVKHVDEVEETQDTSKNARNEEVKDEASRKKLKIELTLDISLTSEGRGKSAPDDDELIVMTSATPTHKKKNFCLYCFKLHTKLARHLELVHYNESEVKKFRSLPAKTPERLEIIAKIRKQGNYIYNTDKRFNAGQLLVCRRPNEKMKKTAYDFLPCAKCKGQYARSVIRHHWRKCTKVNSKNDRIVLVKGRTIAHKIHAKANAITRKYVFPYMRDDVIVQNIRYDELIVLYANKQTEKYGTHQHHYQMIRARLRLLGRFLVAIKEINNTIKTFSDIFQPRNYDHTIEAVRVVAEFDEQKRTFAHPAVASNLGTLLKQVGELLRSEYIKIENASEQKRVEDFLKLREEDFGTSVNRAVAETQMQLNRRKSVVLPRTDDITTLHNYLKSKRQIFFTRLNSKFSFESWRKLAEFTLVSLQLLNRRRAGEIERVYIEDFDSYRGIDQVIDKESYESLTKQGQSFARKYVRFLIRGKRGRGVPVLVPSDLLECLVLIKNHRTDAGVSEKNPYLFGLPSTDADRFKYLRACDLLRQFSEECGASFPDTLRGTELRKHIATKCMDLNLSDNQVNDLANFMGHHEKIHKEIYRQPLLQNDIVKMSQILEAAQGTAYTDLDQDKSSSEDEESSEDRNSKSVHEAEQSSTDEDFSNSSAMASSHIKKERKSLKQKEIKTKFDNSRDTLKRNRWTDKERYTVLTTFKSTLQRGQLPSGNEMQKLIRNTKCLQGRTVPQMRTWLYTNKKNYMDD